MDILNNHFVQAPTGLIVPEYVADEVYNAHKPIRGIDLFAGCGGFSLGMIRAGVEIVAAVEWDAAAALTYMYNLGTYPCKFHFVEQKNQEDFEKEVKRSIGEHKKLNKQGYDRPCMAGQGWISHYPHVKGVSHFWLGDVRKVKGSEILESLGLEKGGIDIICGGPPCQGFSHAGKRQVMDPRNSLVFEFARLICEISPKTFVMENVTGIISMVTPEGIGVIDAFCHILEDGGFGSYDAMKKAMAMQAGNMGAVKTKAKQGKVKDADDADEDNVEVEDKQLQLF